MPTIESSINDGYQLSGLQSSWDDAHDAVGLSNPSISHTKTATGGMRYEYVTGRGSVQYFLARSFFDFDTSGISEAPSSATLKLMAFYQNTCTPCIVVKSGHDPSTASDDWFSTFITGQSVTLSGWGAGDITAYSSSTAMAAVDNYTNFTLNSAALSDIASLSSFKVCVLHNNDYQDTAPTSGNLKTGLYYANSSIAGFRPVLDYTVATTIVDNATFFGSNF